MFRQQFLLRELTLIDPPPTFWHVATLPRFIYPLLAISFLETAAQPQWVRDKVWQGMNNPGHFSSRPDPEAAASQSMVTYLQVFSKTAPFEGFGSIRLEPKNPLSGNDYQVFIELEDRRIFPDMTDSIIAFQRVGISDSDQWLFRKIEGKVSTFSDLPLGPSKFMSIDGGPRKKISAKDLESLFATSPLAYAHIEIDREFAIRLFNRYGKRDTFNPDKLSVKDYRRIFLADSVGHWEMAKIKKGDPEGFIELLTRTRYLCKQGKVGEAKGNIEKLKSLLPGFYAIHSVEGRCLEAADNPAEALLSYRMARSSAPEHLGTSGYLNDKIDALRKSLNPKGKTSSSPARPF